VKIIRLTVHQFTVFKHAIFELAPGVNVFIGENGTGKSHILKLLYSLSEAMRRFVQKDPLEAVATEESQSLEYLVSAMLLGVFRPDSLGRLVRRAKGRRKATILLEWDSGWLHVTLSSLGKVKAEWAGSLPLPPERAVFLPPREVLSIFPGFVASFLRRELEFDRTYYDLCVSLDAKPLRGARDAKRTALLEPIERELGNARVVIENGRFYVKLPDGDMEAPLVAEGLRKLAMIDYLIVNGSLAANAFMFWDEPEANMNPKLTLLTRDIIFGLAGADVQVFIATHDYLLTSELSLTLETNRELRESAAFFALGRIDGQEGIAVEQGKLLGELQNNAILEAFVSLHDREQAAFYKTEGGADGDHR